MRVDLLPSPAASRHPLPGEGVSKPCRILRRKPSFPEEVCGVLPEPNLRPGHLGINQALRFLSRPLLLLCVCKAKLFAGATFMRTRTCLLPNASSAELSSSRYIRGAIALELFPVLGPSSAESP